MAGLFGGFKLPPLPGPISGYGGGTFNMDGTQATPVDTQPFIPTGDFGPRPAGIDQAAAYTGPAKKGGLFGSKFNEPGGWGEKLALIGSVLTQDGGNNPNVQGIMLRRQMEAAAQRAQAQRQQELQDQMALKEWERNNPAPTEAQRNFDFYQRADPATRALYDRMRAGDPYVTTTLPNKQIYSGPASGLPSALGGNPANLDMQPGEEDGYVYTPGPGGRGNEANWKPKGGPAMTSGGGFR